jgi:hypothetical protein
MKLGFASFLTLISIAFMMIHQTAHTQFQECATVISEQQREAALAQIARGEEFHPQPPVILPYHLPLTIHICRRGDATGGFRLGQLDTAMVDLNQMFVQAGIQFFQYGQVIYIDNDNFFTVPDSARRAQLRMQNVVPNTINVYFSNLVNACGQASFPADPIQGVLIDNGCAGTSLNPSTFAHEVGHYLDLYHTHETWDGTRVECPNGSNCTTTGDLLCDTPADPDLSDSVNVSCEWFGTPTAVPSACDTTRYSPQTNNLMSYSTKTCRTLFTSGQITRMITTLSGSRSNLHLNVRYVDRDWTGNQNGTPQEPFTTVAQAVIAASPGNFIFVKPGSYPETIFRDTQAHMDRWNSSGVVVIGQ